MGCRYLSIRLSHSSKDRAWAWRHWLLLCSCRSSPPYDFFWGSFYHPWWHLLEEFTNFFPQELPPSLHQPCWSSIKLLSPRRFYSQPSTLLDATWPTWGALTTGERTPWKDSLSALTSARALVHARFRPYLSLKDISWCMCIDSWVVNKIVVRYSFAIPRVDDMFYNLCWASVFSKIDLWSGYH